MTFIDINKINREKLTLMYTKFINHKDICEGLIEYYNYLEQLKVENYEYYKYLIGLLYIDNYSLLTYKEKNNTLSNEEEEMLDMYNEIYDLDDLLFRIEEDISILYDFSKSSIKINKFNLLGKIELLKNLDIEYASKFNKYYLIEKENVYGNINANDLVLMYKQEMKNTTEKNVTYIRNQTIDGVFQILKIQFKENLKNYLKIISEMIKTYYIWKFFLKKQYPEILFDEDNIIIYLIETGNTNDIIYNISYNDDLQKFLLGEYLHYQAIVSSLDKKKIDWFFNKYNTEEMKIKIKEI